MTSGSSAWAATTELKLNFLAPVRHGVLRARSDVISLTRRTAVVRIDATNGDRLVGAAQGTVTISAHIKGDSLEMFVKDSGPGIAPEDHALIFESFRQTRAGLSQGGGTGLGLAISRGFVEAMQGTITAANRTDRTGAVLTITLPIPAKIEQLDTAA